MGTARDENHAKRNDSELWEVESVPTESVHRKRITRTTTGFT
ncbi:hypothetical protein [Aquisalibacillus elongatus]|nr:hypothetical protein [Aquisalibacillus elongatus]